MKKKKKKHQRGDLRAKKKQGWLRMAKIENGLEMTIMKSLANIFSKYTNGDVAPSSDKEKVVFLKITKG